MNILVIDDHPLFIDGVSQVLKQLADAVDISRSGTVIEAITLIRSNPDIDLIVLDLNLPGGDGISFLEYCSSEDYCIPVVVVSSEEQLGMIRQALNANAMGFIPKAFSANEMVEAFRSILDGNIFIPDQVRASLELISKNSRQKKSPQAVQRAGISAKQYEVLKLMAKGYSNQKISELMNRTEHTVKSHVSVLFQILGADNRTECVEIARRRCLLDQE